MGPRASLDVVENTDFLPLPGIESQPLSPWPIAKPTKLILNPLRSQHSKYCCLLCHLAP
jgi:hypothetical protein